MYTKRDVFLVLSGLLFCAGLSAESGQPRSFSKGDLFISLSAGRGVPSGDGYDYYKPAVDYRVETAKNLISTNAERSDLGKYQLLALEDPISSSTTATFGFEYALADWIGVGASLNNSNSKVENILYYQTTDYFAYSLVYPLFNVSPLCYGPTRCQNDPPASYEYLSPLITGRTIATITTVDIALSLHIPVASNLDPFFKLLYGADLLAQTKYGKIGASLGIRYVFDSGFFLSFEAYRHSYKSRSALEDAFLDTGFLTGIGYRVN